MSSDQRQKFIFTKGGSERYGIPKGTIVTADIEILPHGINATAIRRLDGTYVGGGASVYHGSAYNMEDEEYSLIPYNLVFPETI